MDTVSLVKLFSALIYPAGLMACLLVLFILARWRAFDRLANASIYLCIIIFLSFSNPWLAERLAAGLEDQYPQKDIRQIAPKDALIVLGGGLRIPTAPAKQLQIGPGSDRLWYAAQLYKAGKANKIFISGGNIYFQPGLQGEAYYARQLLLAWGVPQSAIVSEAQSRTTAQNKDNIGVLLKRHKVSSALLVTSALHMPRAKTIFNDLNIALTPASADVLVRHARRPLWKSVVPSAQAFALSTNALHEYYGIAYYQLVNWVKS